MNNIKKLIIIIVILILIGGIIYIVINKKNNTKQEEYEPQEEISEQQVRQTMVSLYFLNKNTNEIEPEARLIDVKEMVKEPYKTLVNLLIEGPKNENHSKTIPERTQLLGTELKGETLTLNFSEEFLNSENSQDAMKCIVKTLTELTEVNSIKVLINGEEKDNLKDTYVRNE